MGLTDERMFQKKPRQPQTTNRAHTRNRMGEREMATTTPTIREIRQEESATQITKEEPETESWINQEYAEHDIDREIRNLSRSKDHGNGGIPGAEYIATRQWDIKPSQR